MLNKKNLVICLFILAFVGSNSNAKEYFDSKNFAFDLIEPPINRNGIEYKREVNQILALQANIDLEELELSAQEKNFNALTLMKRAKISSTPQTHPQLFAMLSRVTDTSITITDAFKNHWQTQRPYLSDSRIKKLISASKGYSYPSGHTTGSYIYAHILGMVYPKKYPQLKQIAEQIAQHRVLVGMHFSHDIEGGKRLALLIVGGLINNEQFQQDLQKAKNEVNSKW